MTKEIRNTLVNALYDRCANGEISVNQREKLILKVNSMFTATESVNDDAVVDETPNADTTPETRDLSPRQKYSLFKEAVYQKCANGEITVEMREELLEKAREKFSASF